MNIKRVKMILKKNGVEYVKRGNPVKKYYQMGSCEMHRLTYFLTDDESKRVDGVLYMQGSNVMAVKDSTNHVFEFFGKKQPFKQSIF